MGIFSSIGKALKKVVGGVSKIAPAVGSFFGPVGTALGGALGAAGNFLGSDTGKALTQAGLGWLSTNQNNRIARRNAEEEDDRNFRLAQRVKYMQNNADFWNAVRSTKEQGNWLREAARRSGFNPLTMLGQGVQQTGGGGSLISAAPIQASSPVSGALDALSRQLSNYDPIAAETGRLQNQLARQQLEQQKNEASLLGGVPRVRYTQSPVEQAAQVVSANSETVEEQARWQAEAAAEGFIGDPRLMRGEEPAEFETDAYGAASQSEFWPYIGRLNRLNNPYFDQFLEETVRKRGNFWENATGAIRYARGHKTREMRRAARDAMSRRARRDTAMREFQQYNQPFFQGSN
jgi:hypothetical protein